MKRVKNIIRSIALISDTHTGSMFSLFPKEYELKHSEEGAANIIKASSGQLKILKFWDYFMGEILDRNGVDTIIHLADAVEGENVKGHGEALILNRIDNQKDCFLQLIRPYMKNRKFVVIAGSGYHECGSMDVHKAIAHELGKNAIYAGFISNLEVSVGNHKKMLNIGHEVGTGTNAQATISNEAVGMAIAEIYNDYPKVDIICRGHTHRFSHTDDGRCHGVIVPCWKAYDPTFKGVRARMGYKQAVVGGVLLLFDEYARVTVEHYLMPKVPHLSDKVWEI